MSRIRFMPRPAMVIWEHNPLMQYKSIKTLYHIYLPLCWSEVNELLRRGTLYGDWFQSD